jgi:hypothetical protein
MNLPPELVRLISEYSKPCTRPNWRQSKPIISTYKLYKLSHKEIVNFRRHFRLLKNINDTEWFYAYKTILEFGLEHYRNTYTVDQRKSIESLISIEGLPEAIILHHKYY